MRAKCIAIAACLLLAPVLAGAAESDPAKQQAELTKRQKEAVALAKAVQKNEAALSDTERQLSALVAERKEKQQAIETRQRELGHLTQGMVRLSRTPQSAVIAMPGKYSDTLHTARLLSFATASVKTEADALRRQLADLDAVQQRIETRREALRKQRKEMAQQQTRLSKELARRKALQAALYEVRQREKALAAQRGAREAASVPALIGVLENAPAPGSAKRAGVPFKPPEAKPKEALRLRDFANAKGRLPLPASGTIVHFFGGSEAGGRSNGIRIDTRPGAEVTAPYDAEVAFAGRFLDYGRMIILRHTGGYHTLLAGLSRLDCVPGQFLLEGEPIGAMGRDDAEGGTELYVELRKDGKPIDPLPWLNGVSRYAAKQH